MICKKFKEISTVSANMQRASVGARPTESKAWGTALQVTVTVQLGKAETVIDHVAELKCWQCWRAVNPGFNFFVCEV